jgi:hypothetical protein
VLGSHPTGLQQLMPLLEQLSPDGRLQQVVLQGPGPVAEMTTEQALHTVRKDSKKKHQCAAVGASTATQADAAAAADAAAPAHCKDVPSWSSNSSSSSSSSRDSSSRRITGLQLKVRGYQLTPAVTEQLPLTGQMLNLVAVDLAGNRLASLPLHLQQLTRLTSLDLGHNRLTAAAVGPTLGVLVNLKHLSIRTNSLDTLPASLQRLRARGFGHKPQPSGVG